MATQAQIIDLETIKDAAHTDQGFQQLLKQHAVSDANHDLGNSFKNIYDAYPNVGTPQDTFQARVVGDGWSIVKSFLGKNTDGRDIDPKKDWIPTASRPHKFFTKDPAKYMYEVDVIEVDTTKGNLPDPVTFFNKLTSTNNLYLIYDFAGGRFREILEKEEKLGRGQTEVPKNPEKNVVYLINREVISDPAPKPNPKDKKYEDSKNKLRKINISFAVDANTDIVKYPQWAGTDDNPRLDYKWDFFSNFDLQLSPIAYNDNLSTVLSFSLEGSKFQTSSTISTTQEGKLANSRNAIVAFLTKIKNLVLSTTKKTQDLNTYYTSLQKKRSGDTLMVLSFFDKLRKYKYKDQEVTLKQLETSGTPLSGEVFVLTHDTFNTLPISLANGANVLFCGMEQNKKQRFYIFRRLKEEPDYTQEFYESLFAHKDDYENKLLLPNKTFYTLNVNYLKLALIHSCQKCFKALDILGKMSKDDFAKNELTTQDILDPKKTITITLGKSARSAIKNLADDFAKKLNIMFRNLYFDLYRLALYIETFKPSIPFSEINTLKREILASTSLTGDVRVKTEKLRTAVILFGAKPCIPIVMKLTSTKEIDYEAEKNKTDKELSAFEKQFKNSEIVAKGIQKFDFIQDQGKFSFDKKPNRLVYGILPFLTSIYMKEADTVAKKSFLEFLMLLKYIQLNSDLFNSKLTLKRVELFTDNLKKTSFELWNIMADFHEENKLETEYENLKDVAQPLTLEEEGFRQTEETTEETANETNDSNSNTNTQQDNEKAYTQIEAQLEVNEQAALNAKTQAAQELAASGEGEDEEEEEEEEEAEKKESKYNNVDYILENLTEKDNIQAHNTLFRQTSNTILEEVVGIPFNNGRYTGNNTGNASNPYHHILKTSFQGALDKFTDNMTEFVEISDKIKEVTETIAEADALVSAKQMKVAEKTKLTSKKYYLSSKLKKAIDQIKSEAKTFWKLKDLTEKTEGGAPPSLVLEDYYFVQFVCMNTLILLSTYAEHLPKEELDDMTPLLPFVGNIVFLMFKSIEAPPKVAFILFTLQMLHYSSSTYDFAEEYSETLKGSDQLQFLPSLFYELFELTYTGDTLKQLKKIADRFDFIEQSFEIPKISAQTLPEIGAVKSDVLKLFRELEKVIGDEIYRLRVEKIKRSFMKLYGYAKATQKQQALTQKKAIKEDRLRNLMKRLSSTKITQEVIPEPWQQEPWQVAPVQGQAIQVAGTRKRKARLTDSRKQTRRKQ